MEEYPHKDGPSLIWDDDGMYREQNWSQFIARARRMQGGLGIAADDFVEMMRYRWPRDRTAKLRQGLRELLTGANTKDDLALLADILAVMATQSRQWIDTAMLLSFLTTQEGNFDAARAVAVLNHLYDSQPKFTEQVCVVLTGWVAPGEDSAMLSERIRGVNEHALESLSLWDKLHPVAELRSELRILFVNRLFVATEGKSDWKHIRAALARFQSEGKFVDIDLQLPEDWDPEKMGSSPLEQFLAQQSKIDHPRLVVGVFDRDEPRVVRTFEVDQSFLDLGYRCLGNNTFALPLPIPAHRQDTPEVCIELCYTDRDLTRKDAQGRRIFLSTEFHGTSGRHLSCDLYWRGNKKPGLLTIVTDQVFDAADEGVALSKDAFATYVLEQAPGFDDVDFTGFVPLFEKLADIARTHGSAQKPHRAQRVPGDTKNPGRYVLDTGIRV